MEEYCARFALWGVSASHKVVYVLEYLSSFPATAGKLQGSRRIKSKLFAMYAGRFMKAEAGQVE